jgi:hypothetical protein
VPLAWRRLLAVALVALLAAGVALVLARVLRHDDAPTARLVPGSGEAPGSGAAVVDPLAWSEGRWAAFAAAAAQGLAHPLYAHSPGGVEATARRVDRYRSPIEAIARESHLDPDTLEAMVFLESAGRPDAAADPKLEGAVGLTQILAETGRNLLGMQVDPAGARRIGRSIRRNEDRGRDAVVDRLRARRRVIDQRFDPIASLRATARYLTLAKRELGRDDLAVVSYHMGIGNLQDVLRDYAGAGTTKKLSYARVYFDSSPLRHRAAWNLLSRLGDDSSNYYWKVLGAEQIMRLYRTDPARLERLSALQNARASAEQVLHPEGSTTTYADPSAIARAVAARKLVALPDDPKRYGFRVDQLLGQFAAKLHRRRALYRHLRPEALGLLVYLAVGTRQIGGPASPLSVTSAVRDARYQHLVAAANIEATHGYSLHTTGFTFDIRRAYSSRKEALAFQFMLDRLQALNMIAWVREPEAIHVTVSSAARVLEPLIQTVR